MNAPFDALIARGVETAATEFGFESAVLEPPYTDLHETLRLAADGARVVVGPFDMQGPFLDIAEDFPDTVFAMIDAHGTAAAEHGGDSFRRRSRLIFGRSCSRTRIGDRPDRVHRRQRQRAHRVVPGRVRTGRTGSGSQHRDRRRSGGADGRFVGYVSPEIARRAATAMYEQGVDVIFVAAGGSGIGVIEAATALSTETRPLWVVGVDSDQYYDISDAQRAHLLTSMFKGFDVGIHAVVAAYDNGTLVAPGVVEVGLAEGAVGYTTTGEHLGASTIATLEQFRDEIVNGTIAVQPVPAEAINLTAHP